MAVCLPPLMHVHPPSILGTKPRRSWGKEVSWFLAKGSYHLFSLSACQVTEHKQSYAEHELKETERRKGKEAERRKGKGQRGSRGKGKSRKEERERKRGRQEERERGRKAERRRERGSRGKGKSRKERERKGGRQGEGKEAERRKGEGKEVEVERERGRKEEREDSHRRNGSLVIPDSTKQGGLKPNTPWIAAWLEACFTWDHVLISASALHTQEQKMWTLMMWREGRQTWRVGTWRPSLRSY